MNPSYRYFQTRSTIYDHRPHNYVYNAREANIGWNYDPMIGGWVTGTSSYTALNNPQPSVEYIDQVIILNPRPVYGTFSPARLPFEPHLENTSIEQEESLVLEEAFNNPISTGSGLSEETITRHLQASVEREKTGGEEESDICAICLDECKCDGYKKMARLECGHGYHEECIKTWLLRKNACPMCKATALKI